MEQILSLDYIKKLIPIRKPNSHKGTYGRVLIVAGSRRFVGAPCITANACMRSGSGLVTLAVESEIFPIIAQKLDEAMVLDLERYSDDFENLVKTADCIAIGPGMEKRDYTLNKLIYIIENSKSPIVIDADGLNVVAENINILNCKNPIVLTPHEGEFARLTNLDINYIRQNKKMLSMEFAKKYGIILILKGSETIITNGKSLYISNIGVPEMATGGMGDCLTGIISSFIGQKIPMLEACILGVYIHSYTANILSKTMYSVLAKDVSNNIPFIIKDILKS